MKDNWSCTCLKQLKMLWFALPSPLGRAYGQPRLHPSIHDFELAGKSILRAQPASSVILPLGEQSTLNLPSEKKPRHPWPIELGRTLVQHSLQGQSQRALQVPVIKVDLTCSQATAWNPFAAQPSALNEELSHLLQATSNAQWYQMNSRRWRNWGWLSAWHQLLNIF